MRIIMPTFERIEWMPPTIDLLKRLNDMGHEVVCITIFPSDYLTKLQLKNVRNKYLYKKEISLQRKIKYIKGISGLLFRMDTLIKRFFARRLSKLIKEELHKGGYLWVVNEMTVILSGCKFLKGIKNYAFTIYELHEDTFPNRNIKRAAQAAEIVVVPEYCRAHIMKSRYRLKKLPIILPNKSEIVPYKGSLPEAAQSAIEAIKTKKAEGKKIVLYMGGIGQERPLDGIVSALDDSDRYIFAIIGRQSEYLNQLRAKSNSFLYLGAYDPPVHLEVARYADIGVLNYVSLSSVQGLNAIFCAPNKIYEYTGLGLPVIANDIPGLRFEILTNQCGELVDFSNKDSVLYALDTISDNYGAYRDAAKRYYEGLDIAAIIHGLLKKMERSN